MISQIDENIERFLQKDKVDNLDVAEYINVAILEQGQGEGSNREDISSGRNTGTLRDIVNKLTSGAEMNFAEKSLLLEVLGGVTKLLRVYGRRSLSLENYIKNLKENRD